VKHKIAQNVKKKGVTQEWTEKRNTKRMTGKGMWQKGKKKPINGKQKGLPTQEVLKA